MAFSGQPSLELASAEVSHCTQGDTHFWGVPHAVTDHPGGIGPSPLALLKVTLKGHPCCRVSPGPTEG